MKVQDPEARPAVRRVDVTSAVDQVAAELRRAIVHGDMAPGSTFSLREIAAQLGVSFIPVREAVRSLEAQGLIITRPGRSAEVAPLDGDDLRAIYRLRKVIEPEIASRVGTRLAEHELRNLEQLLVAYVDAEADVERRWDLHRQFHLGLLRPAATPWDMRALQMLWDAGDRYVRHAFDKGAARPQEPRRRADAHRDLLRAVCSGEPKAASKAALGHLITNEQAAVTGIAEVPSSQDPVRS